MRWRISWHHRTELMPLDATTGITEALLTSVSLTGRYNTSYCFISLHYCRDSLSYWWQKANKNSGALIQQAPREYRKRLCRAIHQAPVHGRIFHIFKMQFKHFVFCIFKTVNHVQAIGPSGWYRRKYQYWAVLMAATAESGCQYGAGKGWSWRPLYIIGLRACLHRKAGFIGFSHHYMNAQLSAAKSKYDFHSFTELATITPSDVMIKCFSLNIPSVLFVGRHGRTKYGRVIHL